MPSIQAHLLKLFFQAQHLIAPPPKELDLVKERASLDSLSHMFRSLAELKITQVDIRSIAGEWITPPQVTSKRTILYLHGGYYLSGSIQSHRNLAGNIAIAAQGRALIIAYRLAPEHPFPDGLEDALAAYDWLLDKGIPAKQIFLAGDSAGGGLVLSALLALRERGKPLPAAGICLSPATDLSMSGESWKFNAKKELVVNRNIAEKIQVLYLGDTKPTYPLASPLFADLQGLPPLLIQVGSDEVLLSDSTSFAERARQAGVEVTLEVWPRMQHVWQFTASFMPEARQAIEQIGKYIKKNSTTSQ
ncbi:MAG: alpha/beta hydrolase [Anaerolineales bacterium]